MITLCMSFDIFPGHLNSRIFIGKGFPDAGQAGSVFFTTASNADVEKQLKNKD